MLASLFIRMRNNNCPRKKMLTVEDKIRKEMSTMCSPRI
uniref:Uncharacterized protein n=1 Tax=Brassica oleracea TaxID=3712 RepID=A0A3P6H7V2_BRAOL|nr:unnamed protein product [Brassica oleracea]